MGGERIAADFARPGLVCNESNCGEFATIGVREELAFLRVEHAAMGLNSSRPCLRLRRRVTASRKDEPKVSKSHRRAVTGSSTGG